MARVARRLYVYYRVADADLAAAIAAVQALQAALRGEIDGLDAELSRRPQPRDGLVTLMETYRHPTRGIGDALAAAIEQRAGDALAPWLRGERHAEVFDVL